MEQGIGLRVASHPPPHPPARHRSHHPLQPVLGGPGVGAILGMVL